MRKWILVSAMIVIAAGALAGGIYYAWLTTPVGPPTSVAEATDTIGSTRFERMPEYRRVAYLEQTRNLMHDLPRDEQRAFFEEMNRDEHTRATLRRAGEGMIMQRVREFAAADEQQRIAMLDMMIDLQEQMGAMRPERRSGEAGRADRWRKRFEQVIQEGNPQMLGLTMEAVDAMQKRRQERGLDDWP